MDGYRVGKDVINDSSQQSYSQHKSGHHCRRQTTIGKAQTRTVFDLNNLYMYIVCHQSTSHLLLQCEDTRMYFTKPEGQRCFILLVIQILYHSECAQYREA